jgi:RNA polymerase sigma factor (sigma-70 family)
MNMVQFRSDVLWRHLRRLAGGPQSGAVTDRVLIDCFTRAGDEGAFEALVTRHGPMVLRVCRQVLGNIHDAEDAFQATFLVLARKAADLSWHESVSAWLHEVAYRLALKARTAACRRRVHESRVDGPLPVAPGLGEITLREAQVVLHQELNRLPSKLRTPLVLCYLEGLTQDQAAQQAGWSLSTLKRRLKRALTLLEGRLQRRGLALAALLSVRMLTDVGSASAAGLEEIVKAGAAFRAGKGAEQTSNAGLLANSLLRTMFLSRLRWAAAVTLVVIVVVVGGGLAAWHALSPDETPTINSSVQPQLARAPLPPVRNDIQEKLEKAPMGNGTPMRLKAAVQGVAFSPDGKFVAGCGKMPDGTLRLWRAATGEEVWRRELECDVFAVAFSSDGSIVAVAAQDKTVRLCDAKSGKELRLLRGHKAAVTSVVFLRDQKTLVSADLEGSVRFWNQDTGKESRSFSVEGHAIRSLALSDDGQLLAAGCEKLPESIRSHVHLWDLPSGKERPSLRYYPGGVQTLAFSPDNKTLAYGGMAGYIMWSNVKDEKSKPNEIEPVIAWGELTFPLTAMVYSGDGGTLACGFCNGVIYVCDTGSGKVKKRLQGMEPPTTWMSPPGVLALSLSQDGKTLAAGGSDRAVRLWDLTSGKQHTFDGAPGR